MQIKNPFANNEAELMILNQLHQLEQKAEKIKETNSIQRNIDRIKEEFGKIGYTIENPLGEKFSETRTDCEANIAGSSTEDLIITEVIRPIIRFRRDNTSLIVQRGIVVAESRKS